MKQMGKGDRYQALGTINGPGTLRLSKYIRNIPGKVIEAIVSIKTSAYLRE